MLDEDGYPYPQAETVAYSRLAWATRVSTSDLLAHLELEAQLVPVLQTLRLCHLFGHGERAFITKIPVELVDLIEEYLVAEKDAQRAAKRWEAKLVYMCWTGRCQPFVHFPEHERDAFVAKVKEQGLKRTDARGFGPLHEDTEIEGG